MTDRKPASARFAICFILGMLLASAGIFFAFSSSQRSAMAWRRQTSAENLSKIFTVLNTYSQRFADYPERPSQLLDTNLIDPKSPDAMRVLINPSWPTLPGYIYLPGVRSDDSPETLFVYENVPENKRKLGRQVVYRSGKIELLSEVDFEAKIKAQEEIWRKSKRACKGIEMLVPEIP